MVTRAQTLMSCVIFSVDSFALPCTAKAYIKAKAKNSDKNEGDDIEDTGIIEVRTESDSDVEIEEIEGKGNLADGQFMAALRKCGIERGGEFYSRKVGLWQEVIRWVFV